MAGGIALVIGPSGVGKISALEKMGDVSPFWRGVRLDLLAEQHARQLAIITASQGVNELRGKVGDERFLQIGREAVSVEAEQCPAQNLVVDVGAGFLGAPGAASWLDAHYTIAFIASPEVAYERWKQRCPDPDPPSIGSYQVREFSEIRQRLYRRAWCRMDVTELAPEAAARRLRELLRRLSS